MTVHHSLRQQNKHKKIVLRCGGSGMQNVFMVHRVVNTTEVLPRTRLTKTEVDNFISLGWTVEIVSK